MRAGASACKYVQATADEQDWPARSDTRLPHSERVHRTPKTKNLVFRAIMACSLTTSARIIKHHACNGASRVARTPCPAKEDARGEETKSWN